MILRKGIVLYILWATKMSQMSKVRFTRKLAKDNIFIGAASILSGPLGSPCNRSFFFLRDRELEPAHLYKLAPTQMTLKKDKFESCVRSFSVTILTYQVLSIFSWQPSIYILKAERQTSQRRKIKIFSGAACPPLCTEKPFMN